MRRKISCEGVEGYVCGYKGERCVCVCVCEVCELSHLGENGVEPCACHKSTQSSTEGSELDSAVT